jgi:hypothetical protein
MNEKILLLMGSQKRDSRSIRRRKRINIKSISSRWYLSFVAETTQGHILFSNRVNRLFLFTLLSMFVESLCSRKDFSDTSGMINVLIWIVF